MRVKAFRLDEQTVDDMEEIRDHSRYPTQSDFVRTAIRRLVREERHRRMRSQIHRELGQPESVDRDQATADWFKRLDRADRGEL